MSTVLAPGTPVAPLFRTLVESRRDVGSRLRGVALPIAVAAHAIVLGTILIDRWLAVPPIPAPTLRASFAQLAPPPPPPPPPAPKPAATTPQVEPPMPKEFVQPDMTPVDIVTTPVPEPILDLGVDGGVEGGVEGGVPGGVPSESTIYRLGEGATSPVLSNRVEPEYPHAARSARVQGTVILRVLVLPDGTVGNIEVLREQPMGLTEAAVAAVRRWHYKPAERDGVPVTFQTTVLVHFKLSN